MALVGCYIHLTGDRRGFWTHVSPATYGDDNAVNLTEEKSAVYNQQTMPFAMKELFDMTYTPSNKLEVVEPFVTLDRIGFLKRGFFLDGNRWLCPLELTSFLYSHYWCKNRNDEANILVSDLENALEELSLHPQSVWDEFAPQLASVLWDFYGQDTKVCLTRDSYLSLVLSRADEWY
jgi:hypothetical protein